MDSKINSWTAAWDCLEIGIRIEPWGKTVKYRREYTSDFGSFTSRWVWLYGEKDSNLISLINNVELIDILNNLVQNHEMLGLFCRKYEIGTENK